MVLPEAAESRSSCLRTPASCIARIYASLAEQVRESAEALDPKSHSLHIEASSDLLNHGIQVDDPG